MSGGWGSCLAGAVQQVDTDPCSNTNPRLISSPFISSLQDRTNLFFSCEKRLDQFNLWAATNCSICVLCFHQRGEALPLRLGGLWLEVCTFGWAHTALQETHRPPAVSVSEMRPGLLEIGPPCSPHEETLMMRLGDGNEGSRNKLTSAEQTFPKNHNLPSGRRQRN